MKKPIAITCFVVGAALATPMVGYAGEDTDMDRGQTASFVKDSVITAKIKAKLASEHLPSLTQIKVDTDANGVVWLSGTAKTQADIDKAVAIAESTDGVLTVKNNLKIEPA